MISAEHYHSLAAVFTKHGLRLTSQLADDLDDWAHAREEARLEEVKMSDAELDDIYNEGYEAGFKEGQDHKLETTNG